MTEWKSEDSEVSVEEKRFEMTDNMKSALKSAFRSLERQDRTEKQLRDKLDRAEIYSREEIDEVLAYLKSLRYIDDLRYAKNFIGYRCQLKSKQQLFFALLKKGVDKVTIQTAMEEEYDAEEFTLICNFLKKKGYYVLEDRSTMREKLIAALFRRGFRMDEILKALDK